MATPSTFGSITTGIFSFGKNIDDVVNIKIDGVNYLSSTAWNTPQSTTALKPDNDFGMGPALAVDAARLEQRGRSQRVWK